MLHTGCIYLPRRPEDGIRISVMSRHTLNDGVTPDPNILSNSYDEHLVELAPPPVLIGSLYKRGLCWPQFEEQYREFIHTKKRMVMDLADRALAANLTILCKEETPAYCHRRILAEEAKRIVPELAVLIR
jgi:uncharacterized protein YeaO (DUF488 family)